MGRRQRQGDIGKETLGTGHRERDIGRERYIGGNRTQERRHREKGPNKEGER